MIREEARVELDRASLSFFSCTVMVIGHMWQHPGELKGYTVKPVAVPNISNLKRDHLLKILLFFSKQLQTKPKKH